PRRSPRRSVWSEEWLTSSSETPSRDRSPTRGAALELPALESEPDRDPEEGAEEGGPDREPPFLRNLTEELQPGAAPECACERDEAQRPNERAASPQRQLTCLERFAPLLVRALLALRRSRGTVLNRVAPVAAPSMSCHGAEATA